MLKNNYQLFCDTRDEKSDYAIGSSRMNIYRFTEMPSSIVLSIIVYRDVSLLAWHNWLSREFHRGTVARSAGILYHHRRRACIFENKDANPNLLFGKLTEVETRLFYIKITLLRSIISNHYINKRTPRRAIVISCFEVYSFDTSLSSAYYTYQ